MTVVLVVSSFVLAVAWLPLAHRFLRGFRNRKNPVSLAICASALLSTYTNIICALVFANQASWQFAAIATHVFELIVVVNFYAAFRWSDSRFANERKPRTARGSRGEYTIPPTDVTNPPREP